MTLEFLIRVRPSNLLRQNLPSRYRIRRIENHERLQIAASMLVEGIVKRKFSC